MPSCAGMTSCSDGFKSPDYKSQPAGYIQGNAKIQEAIKCLEHFSIYGGTFNGLIYTMGIKRLY